MLFPRSILCAAIALVVALPAAAHAQGTYKTVCNDGKTVNATGSNACDMHGGIHKVNTTILHRAPKKSEPARVAQAGTPASAHSKPNYEERRGWRWKRHHDEGKHPKHPRVRCRDGRWESAEGKGKQVCKHHGGLAH